MHTEVVNTDQLNDLEQGVTGLPYDAQVRASIMDTAVEIQKRVADSEIQRLKELREDFLIGDDDLERDRRLGPESDRC